MGPETVMFADGTAAADIDVLDAAAAENQCVDLL
jgi:hypothetical protein